MTNTPKRKKSESEAIQRQIEQAERALALAGVNAEYAKEEAEQTRLVEVKARRRLALLKAKARAIRKQTN